MGPRESPRASGNRQSTWGRGTAVYMDARRRAGLVGDTWLRRQAWELARTPALARKCGAGTPLRRISDFQSAHLLALKEHLAWGPATFRLYFAALRPFLVWAENPVGKLTALWKVASGDSGRRRWLSKGQLTQLLRAARGREHLLVALEALNGLRRVEVLRLRRGDIHASEGFLNVRGKGRDGGKWRQVPICPHLREILLRLGPGEAPDARLLPLSASGADLLLQRAAQRAGFPAAGLRVSHHDLRRTFGRLSHEAGMDLVQLKNLYGHSSLDQTVHYIGLDQAEMRRGLDRLDSLLRPLIRRPRVLPA
jgi:integrase